MKKIKYLLLISLFIFISYNYIQKQKQPPVISKPRQKKIQKKPKKPLSQQKVASKQPKIKKKTRILPKIKEQSLFSLPEKKEALKDYIYEPVIEESCIADTPELLPGRIPENVPDIFTKKLEVNPEKLSILQEMENNLKHKQIANSQNRFKPENPIELITSGSEDNEDYQLDILLYPTLDEVSTNPKDLKNKLEINSGVKVNF